MLLIGLPTKVITGKHDTYKQQNMFPRGDWVLHVALSGRLPPWPAHAARIAQRRIRDEFGDCVIPVLLVHRVCTTSTIVDGP
jgi:hypothetical protein